jgi:xanthosine utilization system XapX-like protein
MGRFVLGMVAGLFVGIVFTAQAAIIGGDDGHLTGWKVLKGANEVCSDPFVWVSIREIECKPDR